MRKVFLFTVILFAIHTLHSQNLLKSRRTSYLTYVYQLNKTEADAVFQHHAAIDSTYMHTLLYTYPTDSTDKNKLDQGYYFRVKTSENLLEIRAFTVSDLSVQVLNNQADLCLQVFDRAGNIIPDATVKLKRKEIKFDQKSQSYRFPKTNKQGNLTIEHNGMKVFYSVDRDYNNSGFKRFIRKFLLYSKVRYIIVPVEFTLRIPLDGYRSVRHRYLSGSIRGIVHFFGRRYESVACLFNGYYCDHPRFSNERDQKEGYIVFNKPKYRPGDTVKVKAFITNWKGKPVNKPLDLKLSGYPKKYTVQHLEPYRKGGYAGEFVLHDSLKLKLDYNYMVTLENKYNNAFMSGYFMYEDYELKATQLKARTDKNKHYKHQLQFIYVKATDENDMNLPGARVELKIYPGNISSYFNQYVFIPDVLWTHKQSLDPVGETKIEIPDSLFPDVNMSYTIDVDVYSADNEHKHQTLKASYCHYERVISPAYKNDSVTFSYKINGNSYPKKAGIVSRNPEGKVINETKAMLPYTMKINPFTSNYIIRTDSLSDTKYLGSASSLLHCFAERIGDSIVISTENPRDLPFHYYIYHCNKELTRGYADSIAYSEKARSKKPYYISLQYMWGGNMAEENYEIPLKDKELKIEVEQPPVIYPRQEVDIEVRVKDYKNQPVENVDITAFGLTKKFTYHPPSLPYFGKSRKRREVINTFNSTSQKNVLRNQILEYKKWKKMAGIDSIEYYKFLYPGDTLYSFIDTMQSGITQFAPFVMSNGSILPVHVIYVDYKPVYFSWSNKENPYSFRVYPGYHNIKLRTAQHEIMIPRVYFPEGKKLIFSVEDTIWNYGIMNTDMPYRMTQNERNIFSQYMFPYRNTFGEYHAYLRQGDRFHVLNNEKTHGFPYYVGPVDPTYVALKTTRGDSLTFMHETGFEYDYSPDILKMRTKNVDDYLSKDFYVFAHYSLFDTVLTEKKILNDWKDYVYQKRRTESYYLREMYGNIGNGRLYVQLKNNYRNNVQPVNVIVKPLYDNTWLRVYEGNQRNFDLYEGKYRLVFIYPEKKYFITEEITVKKTGLNYQVISMPDTLNQDAFGNKLDEIINHYVFQQYNDFRMEQSLMDVYDIYRNYAKTPDDLTIIKGKVWDYSTGEPIMGAQIHLKGTDILHYSNNDGIFNFYAPKSIDSLRVSQPGYEIRYIAIDASLDQIHVHLQRIPASKAVKPKSSHTYKTISGTVRDANTGEPLPGVNVVIKGTTNGTVTDMNGRYSIKLSADESEVIFSYIGYAINEVNFNEAGTANVNMMEDILGLEEVVVVGYGVQRKADMTASVSTVRSESLMPVTRANELHGRAAGITVRGIGTVKEKEPLYIVNGIPVSGEAYREIGDDKIANIEILKDASATAIYGARGANGVVIITTDESTFKQLIEKHPPLELDEQAALAMLNVESSSIRDHFSDYAFWQPELTTDENGKASFKVTFPDDVTRWKTWFLAMNGKKQSGQTEGSIKSYKPLMAQLSMPRFMVEGDSAGFIGKVINYTGGSITVDRTFKIDSNIVFSEKEKVKNSIIDTLFVVAQPADSLTAGYSLKTENGYFDGEERDIPVFKKGVEETIGNFMVLNNDSSFTVKVDDTLSGLQLRADANVMDVIANEAKHIIHYRYLCNEQLASKLKALLIEKQICDLKNAEFVNEDHVLKIIKKLEDNRNKDFLWGWWNVSETSYWISKHVMEALMQARKMGYEVHVDTQPLIDLLVLELSKPVNSSKRLQILELLRLMDVEFGFQKDLKLIEQDTVLNVTDRFRLIELKQFAGLDYTLDSIFKYQEETLFESMYFDNDLYRYYIEANPVQLTLKAYRILRNDSVGADTLQRIRNYFLEIRKSGHWLNTYESAEIITTIFPDIMGEKGYIIPPRLDITGSLDKSIVKFPYTASLDSLDEIHIRKTGDFPVYFSTFIQFWNTSPQPKSDIFEVHSYIGSESNRDTIHLVAGKKVTLHVTLYVKKASDYIMLEIPIPAGCSYDDKKPRGGYEIHREYFRNYTGVFYRNLDKGTYYVDIELMPRFTGTYTLNPAKAEQMYFPVFYGRNEMKKVIVK